MTKLIALRVILAVDDAVDIKDVKPRLTAIIGIKGTEHLGENGEGGGRIHWGTAEVLQGPDRAPPRSRKRGIAGAPNQTELPGA
jgi:hypothetical protein